jgi:hypothetical protein
MVRIASASIVALLLMAASAQAAPVSGWGVLGRLVGTSWGSAAEAFDFRWKVPGEIMVMTNVAGNQAPSVEYRREADGDIGAYYKDHAIGRIDLPTADGWQQSNLSGNFFYRCRMGGSVLNCEYAGTGGRVPFMMQRLSDADFAARLAAIDPKATAPSQEQVWRGRLVKEWGPFASLIRWDGTSFHPEERYYAAFAGDQPVGNVQLAWQKDAGGNLYLIEVWQNDQSGAGYDWRHKDGALVRGWHGTKEAVPFAIAGEDRIEGKSRAPRAQKMLPVEYVATADGFVVTYFQTGGGGRKDVERYVLKPIDIDTMKQWRAQNEAAREEKARAERQAKAERGSGFLDALNLVAQGAAAAVGSYHNAYNGGSMPPGARGVANPLDPTSAQNQAFRQNLQAMSQRAAAESAARQTQASGSGRNVTRPVPAAPEPRPIASAQAPRAAATASTVTGATKSAAKGRTIAYMLRVSVEQKDGDTGNAECFTGVMSRFFPEWTDDNTYEDLHALLASEFARLKQACVAAGRKPLAFDPPSLITDFKPDPSVPQRQVDASQGRPEQVQVSIR